MTCPDHTGSKSGRTQIKLRQFGSRFNLLTTLLHYLMRLDIMQLFLNSNQIDLEYFIHYPYFLWFQKMQFRMAPTPFAAPHCRRNTDTAMSFFVDIVIVSCLYSSFCSWSPQCVLGTELTA